MNCIGQKTRCPSVSRLVLLLAAVLYLSPVPATAQCTTCYTWKPLRIGAGGWLTGLDISPDGTKVVRADTYGAYLWNSTAGQWEQLVKSTSIPTEDHFLNYDQIEGVWEIRIAPSDTRRLYMVWQGYLYRSTDRGARWTKTSFTRRNLDPNDGNRTAGQRMAVDPANPNVVYVGTNSNGVWRTFDGGATWAQVTAITAGASPGHPGIAFAPTSGTDANGRTRTIYVPSNGNGVWRSTDAGATWTRTSGGPTRVWHAQVASDGIYYCATRGEVWKFASGAWTRIASGAGWEVVAPDPANPARIIIADDGARMGESLDRGATWNPNYWRATGRTATDIPWLAWTKEDYMSNGDMRIDPVDGRLYFAEGIGVWQTPVPAPEAPFTWTSQSKGIEQLVANWIWSVPGGALFLTAWDRPVFRSTNPDAFPATHGPNRNNSIVYGASVEHAVNNPSFLVVNAGWQTEESSYSTDGGVTWTKFSSYPPWGGPGLGHIAVSTDQNWVWVPNANKSGYYTKNRGATWTPLPSPVNGAMDWSQYNNRHSVTADRVTPNKFYLYDSNSGLYVSTNGGDSWTRAFSGHIVNSADGFNIKLKSVPGKAGHLFFTNGPYGGGDHVGPDSGELFKRSTDGGVTWTTIPNVLEVYDFGFGKEPPGGSYPAIYIAGFVNRVWGIWRSDDQAQTWVQVGDRPLSSLDMLKAVDGDKNTYGRVYVGFQGSGYAYGGLGGTPPPPPPPAQTLSVAKAGTGTGTVTSAPAGINCGAACSAGFAAGTLVTLSAAPASGSTFAGWSGACAGTGACNVTMSAARSVTATFNANSGNNVLTILKSGDGSGTVTSTPAGISCGATCSSGFASGTVVTLSASQASGSLFLGWSGACTGTGACSVTMSGARSVTASFGLAMERLTVTRSGSGSVTSAPDGISCGSDCTELYNRGTVVTLTAAATTGNSFAGWSGDCSGTTSTCQVTMNAVRNVAASFRTGSAPPPDGDFNRDGWVDLLWGNRVSGALYSWYLKSAAMVSGNYLTPNGLADVSWQVVAVADLDQNGHTDLLWRNSVTGDLGAWFMNGTAQVRSVSSPVTLPGSGSASGPGALSWEVRGVADFTGDRKVDILWRNSVTGDLWVSINGTTPTGAYLNPRRESSLNQQIGGVADFDNDGRLDLVWHDRSTGDLKIWLMTGTTAARYATPTPARLAAPWRLLRAADYNNDGKPDLLFENGTTRELLVWYMNGTARATQGYVNPSKSSTVDWRVVPR